MMTVFVDIDGIVCEINGGNYFSSKPIKKNIEKINRLYDKGNKIILWTARGTVTGRDWTSLTIEQMKEWNVKYHELRFGKPYYDILIDDRAVKIKDL